MPATEPAFRGGVNVSTATVNGRFSAVDQWPDLGVHRGFGSVARGEDRSDSDVDLLVEMEEDRSLLDLVGLEQDLEELLQRRVDVMTDESIHPAIRTRIVADARAL
jgi:hypothetical protein